MSRSTKAPPPAKSLEATAPLLPPSLSRADFILGEEDFDLFGEPVRHGIRHGGLVRHLRTRELSNKISQLVEFGVSQKAIARSVGIAYSTLTRYYFRELNQRAGKPGRRQHQATPQRQRSVARLVSEGRSQAIIAAELGITVPTLRRHYMDQLKARAAPDGRSPSRNTKESVRGS